MIKQITLKLSQEEAQIIKEILEVHKTGYTKQFPPDIIISVRNVIEKLS